MWWVFIDLMWWVYRFDVMGILLTTTPPPAINLVQRLFSNTSVIHDWVNLKQAESQKCMHYMQLFISKAKTSFDFSKLSQSLIWKLTSNPPQLRALSLIFKGVSLPNLHRELLWGGSNIRARFPWVHLGWAETDPRHSIKRAQERTHR